LLPVKPYPLPLCRFVPAANASAAPAEEGLQSLLSGGQSQSALYKIQMMVRLLFPKFWKLQPLDHHSCAAV
jgi:hypothetical protein